MLFLDYYFLQRPRGFVAFYALYVTYDAVNIQGHIGFFFFGLREVISEFVQKEFEYSILPSGNGWYA